MGKGCMHIKDCFKPIYSLLLMWLLDLIHNIHSQFCSPNVNSHDMPMIWPIQSKSVREHFSIINKAHPGFPAYFTLRHFQTGMEMGTDAGVCTHNSGPSASHKPNHSSVPRGTEDSYSALPWVMWEAVTVVEGIPWWGLLRHMLANGALVYPSQGGRYCTKGCTALR